MQLKSIRFIIMFLFFIIVLSGCIKNSEKKLSGKFIYVLSNKIKEIELNNRQNKFIYQGNKLFIIDEVNRLNNQELLFELENLEVSDMFVASFHLANKKLNMICQGVRPLYVKQINSVFYYKWDKKGLYKKSLDANESEHFITENIYTHLCPPPVQISSSEIVYYTKEKKIGVYNFQDETFRILDVTGYIPWAFFKSKESLICRNEANEYFYFINVDTLEIEKINIWMPKLVKWSIIPVEKYNCLIYSKVRMFSWSETEDMYIYWVDNKKEQKYLKDTKIDSGVYIDK